MSTSTTVVVSSTTVPYPGRVLVLVEYEHRRKAGLLLSQSRPDYELRFFKNDPAGIEVLAVTADEERAIRQSFENSPFFGKKLFNVHIL